MKKLKLVKKEMKKLAIWSKYKKAFKHHQMKLMISKIALVYGPDLSVQILVKLEHSMLVATTSKHPLMFVPTCKLLAKFVSITADWITFGKFLYYIYQTSTFYQDKKKQQANIFINHEIEMNDQKRAYFYKWMHSMDITTPNLNHHIIQIQKVVF